jgi:hypothetical protein
MVKELMADDAAPAREPFTPPDGDDRPCGERPRLYGRG